MHRITYLYDALKQKKKNFGSDDDEDEEEEEEEEDDDDCDNNGDVTMTIFPLYSIKKIFSPHMQQRKIEIYFFNTKCNLRRNTSLSCTCWLLMKA
jgi:hypothetical protein